MEREVIDAEYMPLVESTVGNSIANGSSMRNVNPELVKALGDEFAKMMRGAGMALTPEFIDRMRPIDLSDEQVRILRAPIDPRDVRLKQNQPYLPWQACAERFDRAFGPGHWAVVPISAITEVDTRKYIKNGEEREATMLAQQWALLIDGQLTQYVVVSEHEYVKGSAAIPPMEALKSSAYFRILKALGGGRELNDKQWVNAWLAKYRNNPPKVAIDGEDVIRMYDAIMRQSQPDRAFGLILTLTDGDAEAAEKVRDFLKERYGEPQWAFIVTRHLRSEFPGFVATNEFKALVDYIPKQK